jgi:hypothetical protein
MGKEVAMIDLGNGVFRRRFVAAVLALTVVLPVWSVSAPFATAQRDCQTPFLVYTDPANPGITNQTGDVAKIDDSGLLGDYRGDGRFAGYTINGSMGAIVNTKSGIGRVQGEFTATSPGGGSSIRVWYTGTVDFGAGMATGNFVAGDGTGSDAGYRAAGTIEGTVVAPMTLEGVDIGLC